MKRILIPVDGSPRSMLAVEQVKSMFSPKTFEVVLLMVGENSGYSDDAANSEAVTAELEERLDKIAERLNRYSVIKKTAIGKAGGKIVECARETGAVMIVMTKSTKAGQANMIGMTASYVIRHAQCSVLIVKESLPKKPEPYRGLVYRKAAADVTLRGQLSLKQSECLLPSVKGDVIYRISVTRGRLRFMHSSYDPETKEWDLEPTNGQQASCDIEEGETVELHVNAEGNGKFADRIRVVNRNMKTEAVFRYEILPDEDEEAGDSDESDEPGAGDGQN
jgi:nucleotide-binding universal stress UspA family protein